MLALFSVLVGVLCARALYVLTPETIPAWRVYFSQLGEADNELFHIRAQTHTGWDNTLKEVWLSLGRYVGHYLMAIIFLSPLLN